jgi:hypothetical protein
MIFTIRSRAGFRYGTKVAADLWTFDSTKLSTDQWTAVERYCVAYPEVLVRREESPAPAPKPAPAPAPVAEPVDDRPDVVERAATVEPFVDPIKSDLEHDLRATVHFAEAEVCLAQYEAQGLIHNEHNKALIEDFVNTSATKGFWSAEIVKVAVDTLRKRLQWGAPPKPVAPPPTPPDEEVLGTLPSGERQLSLKHSPSRTATVQQTKDWLARYRAANNLLYVR